MMDPDRFTTLAQRFIDGTIEDDEAAELHKAIEESTELRERLRIQASMHAVIERRFRRRNVTVNRKVQAALRDPSQKKGAITRIMDKLEAKRPKKKSGKSEPIPLPSERPSRRNFFFTAAAIALTLLIPAIVYLILGGGDPDDREWNQTASSVPVARAKPTAGYAVVQRDGKSRKLKREQSLLAGDGIATLSVGSVTIEYPDKTVVLLSSDSSCELQPDALKDEAGIAIKLKQGELTAVVLPQPTGKPMMICTPHGCATVVGTRFKLSASAAQSRVEVEEGKVHFSNKINSQSVLVYAGQSAVLSPDVALEAVASTRDPALWPFSAQSPWNMPMGSSAQFIAVDSPHFDPSKGVDLAVDADAIPIYITTPQDPMRQIYRNVKTNSKSLRVPLDAQPERSPNHFMNIVDERHAKVYEFVRVDIEPDNVIHLGNNSYYNSLRRTGVYDDNRQHGSRIYGGSSMGGIVRKGELSAGIRHAIGISVVMSALNGNAPSGRPYIWPACFAEVESDRLYGKSGNLFLGSLLAIPPSVDVRMIGVGTSGPAFEIARALQDYGAYIIDHSGESPTDMKFFFEPGAKAEIPNEMASQLAIVMRYVKVVANNTDKTVGGGGKPRRQLAPPFAKEFDEKEDSGGQY